MHLSDGEHVALMSELTGGFVMAQGGGNSGVTCNSPNLAAWEKFKISVESNYKKSFKTPSGWYLHADHSRKKYMDTKRQSVGSHEKFIIEEWPILKDNYLYIQDVRRTLHTHSDMSIKYESNTYGCETNLYINRSEFHVKYDSTYNGCPQPTQSIDSHIIEVDRYQTLKGWVAALGFELFGAMSESAVEALELDGELTGQAIETERAELQASKANRKTRCLGVLSRIKKCVANIGFRDFTPAEVDIPSTAEPYTGQFSYRGEVRFSMDDIFRAGWKANGKNANFSSVQASSTDSAYIASSSEPGIAERYTHGQNGYYIIDNSAGRSVQVDNSLDRAIGVAHYEVLYPGGIRPTEVYAYIDKSGNMIRNPYSMRPRRLYEELTSELHHASRSGVIVDELIRYPEEYAKYSDNGSTLSAVNFPEVSLPEHTSRSRLLHIHKNAPGVLTQINQAFAQKGLNIAAQYLQTNENIGYVVIDVETDHAEEAFDQLQKIDGTIETRILH
jgi:hypothetical protein